MGIEIRHDRRRGCGWRKVGGLYMVAPNKGMNCGRLPLPLTVCPTCGCGVHPSRAWTWVDADKLFEDTICTNPHCIEQNCPLSRLDIGRAGLIWIGEKFYPTVEKFQEEAREMGISRRIKSVPKGFKVGETWILLAHRKAIHSLSTTITAEEFLNGDLEKAEERLYTPGVFTMFRPTAIEVIVTGNESDEEIAVLEKRGLTPVKIERVELQPSLLGE